MKTSASIDYFMLYLSSNSGCESLPNLDKEWYYNIVSSVCSNHQNNKPDDISLNVQSIVLKSKQCALMLSNLDGENIGSILSNKDFKLTILKDCLLLGAQRTEHSIQRLPSTLKRQAFINNLSIENDFQHPLWTASTNYLFNTLNDICKLLPNVTNSTSTPGLKNKSSDEKKSLYNQKMDAFIEEYNFYSFILPLIESINGYLKCVNQYPSLKTFKKLENKKSLVSFILFQLCYIRHVTIKHETLLTVQSIYESFLCVFNLLIDSSLCDAVLCKQSDYSLNVSNVIKHLYSLIKHYFFQPGDDNLVYTPSLSQSVNINYSNQQQQYPTSDVLFSINTFNILLKLRFIIMNYRWSTSSTSNTGKTNFIFNSILLINKVIMDKIVQFKNLQNKKTVKKSSALWILLIFFSVRFSPTIF
jgi:hypothetical protein